jgi:hypothetical protein
MSKQLSGDMASMNSRRQVQRDWRPENEKIGVSSIRIWHAQLHATAVVGSFFTADKLLLAWSIRLQGVLECEFEIAYNDGRTISGVYRFRRKGATRPALMQYVRATAHAMCQRPAADGTCPVRGLANRPLAFLEQYDTEDFAEAVY